MNIAFAEYNINGEIGELVGISGGASRLGTVGVPEKRLFETIATGNNSRMMDSEVKILEHLGGNIPFDATGTLHLFSELPLCISCSGDRKSTRLNSSHTVISYAVFCLKKKNLAMIFLRSKGIRQHRHGNLQNYDKL